MGLFGRKKYEKWSEERVLSEMKEWAEKHGRAPRARDVSPSLVSAAVRYFGSWAKAKRKAGLAVYPPGRKKKE
ncbi:MAG: hypothetical protein DSO02_05340 [Hadesarchaea archaeon]|nr:MAG: hypothetical protein DSO02_05340 [Hadesarchaea archaeon]